MDTAEIRKCSICGEEKPLTREYFRSNGSDKPFRYECKACEKTKNDLQKHDAKRQEILDKRVETAKRAVLMESLSALTRSAKTAPHPVELIELLSAGFGGLDGYANEWHAHFRMTEPGGPQRTRLLQDFARLVVNNAAMGGAQKPLDYYTEEELEKELQERMQSIALRLIGNEDEPITVEVLDSSDHVEVRETG